MSARDRHLYIDELSDIEKNFVIFHQSFFLDYFFYKNYWVGASAYETMKYRFYDFTVYRRISHVPYSASEFVIYENPIFAGQFELHGGYTYTDKDGDKVVVQNSYSHIFFEVSEPGLIDEWREELFENKLYDAPGMEIIEQMRPLIYPLIGLDS